MKLRESGNPEIVKSIKYIIDEVLIDLNSSRPSNEELNASLHVEEIPVKVENLESLNLANNSGSNVSQEIIQEVKTEDFQNSDSPVKTIYEYSQDTKKDDLYNTGSNISQEIIQEVKTEDFQNSDSPVKTIDEYSQDTKKDDLYNSVVLPVDYGVVSVNEYNSTVLHANESSNTDIDLPVLIHPLKSIYDYSPQKKKIDVYGKIDEPKKTANELGIEISAENNEIDEDENIQSNKFDSLESDRHPLKTIYQLKTIQNNKSAHNLQPVSSPDGDLVITVMTGHIITNEIENEIIDKNISSDKYYREYPTEIMPTVV